MPSPFINKKRYITLNILLISKDYDQEMQYYSVLEGNQFTPGSVYTVVIFTMNFLIKKLVKRLLEPKKITDRLELKNTMEYGNVNRKNYIHV